MGLVSIGSILINIIYLMIVGFAIIVVIYLPKKIRIIAVFIIISIVTALVIEYVPIPHKVNFDFTGYQYRIGDQNYSEEVSIEIKGTYKNYLLKDDQFYGVVKYDLYHFDKTLTIKLSDNIGHILSYNDEDGFENLGHIIFSKDLNEFVILVNDLDGGWSGDSGLIATSPTQNRKDSIELLKSLSKRSKWLSESTLIDTLNEDIQEGSYD